MCGFEFFPAIIKRHRGSANAETRTCGISRRRAAAVLGIPLAVLLLSAADTDASPMQLKARDRSGAAFPDVLVIVKSLEGKGEIFRALTDSKGIVPVRELPAGLYRVIATCPYGICQTKVQEFYVKGDPVQLDLALDVKGSGAHGEGYVIEVGPSRQLKVQVTDSEGRAVRLAFVIARDSDAQHERWYKTDSGGSATIELPDGPVTVVVVYGGNIASKTLSPAGIDELRAKGAPLVVRV